MCHVLVEENKMLEEIRTLLGLTIEEFTMDMNWPNAKYYDYIKNGYKRGKDMHKKCSHPTINKVFTGINHAINQCELWQEKSHEISKIVHKWLLPEVKETALVKKKKV